MPNIKIRGHEYKINLIRDSFNRRATQFQNQIIEQFKILGLTSDDINIIEEKMPMKKAQAGVSWWIYDHHCHFSFNKMTRYVDNLLVVLKVIEHKISELINEKITIEEFIESFKEDNDFDNKRNEAREFFGLEKNHMNLEIIDLKYKKLAKSLHPDMPTGDVEKFKQLNKHHKILKRELE